MSQTFETCVKFTFALEGITADEVAREVEKGSKSKIKLFGELEKVTLILVPDSDPENIRRIGHVESTELIRLLPEDE